MKKRQLKKQANKIINGANGVGRLTRIPSRYTNYLSARGFIKYTALVMEAEGNEPAEKVAAIRAEPALRDFVQSL